MPLTDGTDFIHAFIVVPLTALNTGCSHVLQMSQSLPRQISCEWYPLLTASLISPPHVPIIAHCHTVNVPYCVVLCGTPHGTEHRMATSILATANVFGSLAPHTIILSVAVDHIDHSRSHRSQQITADHSGSCPSCMQPSSPEGVGLE